jgi:hypothetical protein
LKQESRLSSSDATNGFRSHRAEFSRKMASTDLRKVRAGSAVQPTRAENSTVA